MPERKSVEQIEQKHHAFAEMKRLAETVQYKTADYYAFCDAIRTSELELNLTYWHEELEDQDNSEHTERYCQSQIRIHESLTKDHNQRVYQAQVDMPGYASMYDYVTSLEQEANGEDWKNHQEYPYPNQLKRRRYAQLQSILFSKGDDLKEE